MSGKFIFFNTYSRSKTLINTKYDELAHESYVSSRILLAN